MAPANNQSIFYYDVYEYNLDVQQTHLCLCFSAVNLFYVCGAALLKLDVYDSFPGKGIDSEKAVAMWPHSHAQFHWNQRR